MDNNDYHFHWWHWLIILAVTALCLGVGYTWIKNYDIVKVDDQSVTNETKRIIEHPIDTTRDAVNDVTNNK